MNVMMDDERDEKGITRNEVVSDDALRRADDGDFAHDAAADFGVAADAARVRAALAAHPWPVAGEELMTRLRTVPASAVSPAADSAPTSSTAPAFLGTERRVRDVSRGLRRPRTPIELAAAFALVAAVVVVLTRGAGDLAPVSDPGAADDAATRTAEASAAATAGPVAPPPLPPDGTRLYASVAELVADPPPAGETVWVDAYHGEFILTWPGWGRGEDMSGCPSTLVSPLLDKPFLLQLGAFNGFRGSAPGPGDGPVLIAAGRNAEGEITVFPDLPRHGRLVMHFGDPVVAHCEASERIVLVERVAHVFEAKPDWMDLHQAIRESENDHVIEHEGPVRDDDEVEAQLFLDAGTTAPYIVAVPAGLHEYVAMRQNDGLPYPVVSLLQRSDQPGGSFRIGDILLRRYVPGHPAYDGRRRELGDRIENGPIYTQRDTTGRLLKTGAEGPGLEFMIVRMPADGSGWTKVRAIAGVGSILYEFEARFTDDAISAQGFLWRFEAVVDRFRVPAEGRTNAVPTATAPLPRPCPTRSVPEPLPTSTAYSENDVMNDLMVTGLGWDELPDAAIIISATVGAVVKRTATLYAFPTLEPWPDGRRSPSRPSEPFYTLWQANTVEEVFKGAERVAVGDTVLIPYHDDDNAGRAGAASSSWGAVALGEIGELYLFRLDDLSEPSQELSQYLVYEEPRPEGLAFALRGGGAGGRLIVTYDRVRYSDSDRLRTEFAQDMTGCAFLERLREEIRRAGANDIGP